MEGSALSAFDPGPGIEHHTGGVQIINLAAFTANSAVVASSHCRFFYKADVWLNIVTWSCWNTVGPCVYVQAPWDGIQSCCHYLLRGHASTA